MVISGHPKYIVVPIAAILLICQFIAAIVFVKQAMSEAAIYLLVIGFILNVIFLVLILKIYFKPDLLINSHIFAKGFFTIVALNLCVIFFLNFDLFLSLASPSVFTWVCILILFVSKDFEFKRVSKFLGSYEVSKKDLHENHD